MFVLCSSDMILTHCSASQVAIKLGKTFEELKSQIRRLLELLPGLEVCGQQEENTFYVHQVSDKTLCNSSTLMVVRLW